MGELTRATSGVPERAGGASGMPALIVRAGGQAEKRFLEFFAAQIRNRNTREAYLRAVRDFLDWAKSVGVGELLDIEPVHVPPGWNSRCAATRRKASSSSSRPCGISSTGWSYIQRNLPENDLKASA